MSESWYYADARNQQQGPIDAERLRELHARGEVSDATLVWHAGLRGWEPLGQHAATLGIAGRIAAGPRIAATPRPAAVAKPAGGSSGWVIAIAVLFIGIMFLGIIAAIALPAYSDYTVRARVANARMTATSLKYQVEEFRASNDRCPSNGDEGFYAAEYYADDVVSGIELGDADGGCAIRVVFHAIGGAEAGRELVLARSSEGIWRETSDLPDRVLPANLRR